MTILGLDIEAVDVPFFSEQCSFCSHYRGCFNRKKDLMLVHTCDAFPRGIPHDIIFDKVKHNRPYKGDKGIVFQECND